MKKEELMLYEYGAFLFFLSFRNNCITAKRLLKKHENRFICLSCQPITEQTAGEEVQDQRAAAAYQNADGFCLFLQILMKRFCGFGHPVLQEMKQIESKSNPCGWQAR